MAVPVRTMPPQLALALRHRSHCQLALRGGCSARERNKRVHFSSPTDWTRAQNQQHPMNNLLKAPQVTQHPSPGHFFSFYLHSCTSGLTRVLSVSWTLWDFYFSQRGHCRAVFILSNDVLLGSEGSRATARPLRSHSLHALPWQHLAPPSLNKHSMFDWVAAEREAELKENQRTERRGRGGDGGNVVLYWGRELKKRVYAHMYVHPRTPYWALCFRQSDLRPDLDRQDTLNAGKLQPGVKKIASSLPPH